MTTNLWKCITVHLIILLLRNISIFVLYNASVEPICDFQIQIFKNGSSPIELSVFRFSLMGIHKLRRPTLCSCPPLEPLRQQEGQEHVRHLLPHHMPQKWHPSFLLPFHGWQLATWPHPDAWSSGNIIPGWADMSQAQRYLYFQRRTMNFRWRVSPLYHYRFLVVWSLFVLETWYILPNSFCHHPHWNIFILFISDYERRHIFGLNQFQ